MKKCLILLGSLILSGATQAAHFTLETENTEPLYQTTLTKPVYEYSGQDKVNDLAITNGNGESVPYALLPYQQVHLQTQVMETSKPLVIFPMHETAINTATSVNIQLNEDEHTTSINVVPGDVKNLTKTYYIFDLGEKHDSFKKLTLDWQGQEGELITVNVAMSNNLNDWTKTGQGVLLKVSAAGQNIIQNSILLDKLITARYLQIQPLDTTDAFKLTSVNVEFNQIQDLEQPTLWQEISFLNREQDKSVTHIDFESASRLPATSMKIDLPQINTITQVTVYTRNHQEQSWQQITKASLYRLNKQGKEYSNQNIKFNATSARFWRLSFNQTKGGIGNDNPRLSLGWLPDIVVWNARGTGPFSLHVSEGNNLVNRVAITNLVNSDDANDVRLLPIATIGAAEPGASVNVWDTSFDYTRFLLWGGLIAGVLVLAGMANSLLKSSQKE